MPLLFLNKNFLVVKKTKLGKKLFAKYYSYIIKLSFSFSLPILKKFLIKSLIVREKDKNVIWYLDHKRSLSEVEFLNKKFNLLLTNVLFIKEIILFLDEKDDLYQKKVDFFYAILSELKVKILISPAIHYKLNIIGYLAKQFDMKFIVVHRECYSFSTLHTKNFSERLRSMREKFRLIDRVIVHNDVYKDLFVKFGQMDKDNVLIIGPLRFCKLKDISKKIVKNKKKIVFFSFTPAHSAWIDQNPTVLPINHWGEINYFLNNNLIHKNIMEKEVYFYEHFIQSHLIFISNAIKFPEIEFEIKIKWQDHRWSDLIDKIILLEIGKQPHNLKITSDSNYWNKIQESFLICGYCSTTLLEGAYLNVPAAQFVCGELNDKKIYEERCRIKGHEDSFFIVKEKNDLTELIINRKKLISEQKLNESKKHFFRYVANIDKENLEDKFQKTIEQLL